MKKLLLFTLPLFVLVSCEPIHVTSIILSASSLSLMEGESKSLTCSVLPENAKDRSVAWSSSDESVAKVSGGLITAVVPGTAIITATAVDNNVTASCKIEVKRKVYEIEGIEFERPVIELKPGETADLALRFIPEEATYKDSIQINFRTIWYKSEFNKYFDHITNQNIESGFFFGFDINTMHFTARNKGTVRVSLDITDSHTGHHFEPSCTITIPEYAKPEAVDLGLSVNWSSINLCAPEEAWHFPYFAWGDTTKTTIHNIDTYPFVKKGNQWTGVPDEYVNIGNNISGTDYDAAHMTLGSGWRIPTTAELQELCDKCTWTKETIRDVNGFRVTGPSGNSIFLPFGEQDGVINENVCLYWSSEIDTTDSSYAMALFGTQKRAYISNLRRYEAYYIRPVKDK